jgi:predicted TIM-barrel fold metal-dependent hydrolase
MPFTGVEDAVAELRRVVGKKGIRAVQLLKFPSGGEFLTPEDDPFWAAVEELGVCVVAHHNFGGDVQADPLRAPMTSSLVMSGTPEFRMLATLMTCDMTLPTIPIVTILQLMLTGTLDRFPGLRFHIAESLIGWLPYWLEQMEDRYDRHRFWSNVDLPRRPLQYVRDHFTFSFMEDHVGVAMRHQIGLDNICWASDFPHSVSDWPWSLETVQREFKDVPADERLKMQALNVLRQLRIVNETEYDHLVSQPLDDRFPDSVPARGARRL